ncbi:DNA-binding protein [Bacillus sp. ISL-47]|uniref:DNA-binding protein n=1 Tax=Bacillus sp. ISL-47 TaxID=2819130 RepID=UPI001BE84989|nr:DNA-binding protein [Bacillus sp. ISL-47]MBT2691194.1 DNA-binding protein [Bacillus sp. ISL-47]
MPEKQIRESELPVKLAKPAQRALEGAGFYQLEQLAGATETDILKLHGMGPNAMEKLRKALAEKGLAFAEE